MIDSFTTIDMTAAQAEGWMLETIYDTRGFFAQIIVPAKGSTRFTTSYEAAAHVLGRARSGDTLSTRAMQTVAASRFDPIKERKRK